MQKRGQVTLFIIVGIVILSVILGFIFLSSDVTKEELETEAELVSLGGTASVKFFVDSCLKTVSEKGLDKVARQGGYYDVPLDYSILFFDDMLPYYYADGKTIILGVEEAEKELEKYIEENLPTCLDDFASFTNEGYQITTGDLRVMVDYGRNTRIELDYPLEVSKGVSIGNLDTFIHTINADMPTFLEISNKLVSDFIEREGYLCLTCMDRWASEENIIIDAFPIYDTSQFENDIILFRLEDQIPKTVQEDTLTFEFIVEYLQPTDEIKLEIVDLPRFELVAGELFEYQVLSNKDNIIFFDNTDLFDISSEGMISFPVSEEHSGTYFVEIRAEDQQGNVDTKLVTFTVI